MITNELLAIDKFICENNNFGTTRYHHRFADKDVYVPTFIVESKWTCSVEHMIDKWNSAQKHTDCYGFFIKFYVELDTENKAAMVEWILNNREKGYIRV